MENENYPDVAIEIDRIGERMIKLLAEADAFGEEAAEAITLYEKRIGITMTELALGREFDVEGTKIKDLGATNRPALAKCICWRELLGKEKAERLYKSFYAKVDGLKARLNSKQSIFRRLDSTP